MSVVVLFPKRYTPIPKPYAVVKIDDHYMVCIVDSEGNPVEEISIIHCDKYTVRRWARKYAELGENK